MLNPFTQRFSLTHVTRENENRNERKHRTFSYESNIKLQAPDIITDRYFQPFKIEKN